MTTAHPTRTYLERLAAAAALGVPGVAYLRPGLADLLRGSPAQRQGGSGGVRARATDDPPAWRIEVHLAVVRGHRALDVTRAVRAAVEAATTRAATGRPAVVSVTVTGVV
ncbi:Asp23/Gls24 family envelope stress response protein [Streptomyces sp. A5-4]|uniref:Asp23/Gls24 family envelope stress response protein n=1 Tax=Streptomyces sp. A5-4 TaxID=3384771 RepID=UPI003DA92F4A